MGPKKKTREQQPAGSITTYRQVAWCADVISVVAEFLPPTDQYQKPLMLVSKLWLEGVAQQHGMKVLDGVHWPFAALRHRESQNLRSGSFPPLSTADLEDLVENVPSSQVSNLALWEVVADIDMTCLSRMENLTALRFWTQAVHVPRGLIALTSLRMLHINNSVARDWSTIRALVNLEDLRIDFEPPFSVDTVSHLTPLRNLSRLSLVADHIDEHMKVIGQMTQLTVLSCYTENGFGDNGMESLSNLVNLTSLNLCGQNSTTGKGFRLLGKLKKLTYFCVNCKDFGTIRNEDLVFFNELQELQSFTLKADDSFTLTDEGLEHIAAAQSLRTLDFRRWKSSVTAAGAKQIERLQQLKSLHLSELPSPTEATLASLASVAQLEHLEISSPVSMSQFSALTTFKKLKTLRVELYDVVIGESRLSSFDEHHSCLEDLRVVNANDSILHRISFINTVTVLSINCSSVTDDGVQYLSSLVNLEKLILVKLAITGSGFSGFGTKLRKLTNLKVQGCINLEDHGMHHVCEIKSLKLLEVNRCHSLTDDAFSPIAKLRNVTWLSVAHCVAVQCESGFTEIAGMRSLETLWLEGGDISSKFLDSLRRNESLEMLNVCFSSSWKRSVRFSAKDMEELVEHKQGAHLRVGTVGGSWRKVLR